MPRPPDHPLNDLDAPFSVVFPKDTFRVAQELRKAGFEFDISINTPKDDETEEDIDILWFRPDADFEKIKEILESTSTPQP